ncbi:VCBS domain-containing protein [Bradyrhizobium guangxiense]
MVGSYGTLVVTKATGAYTYTLNTSSTSVQALAEGQQATEQFTYTNADNHGGTGSSTLTVTVTGSNDPATITVSGSQDVSVTEAGTVAGDPSASGQLAVHDVDNGEAHFAVPASLAGTYGNFTFNAATGAWTYALDPVKSDPLAAGQQVTDTLTVTSVDGTASHDIVVSITGTNDAAVIGNPDQHDVTEDGVLTASGTLSISDVDLNQSSFQTAVASAPGNLGTLMIDANGAYSYSVANGLVQYLGQGETRDEVFTVKALDGTTKDVTFTIHGVNDAADIGGPTQHDVTEDGQLTASGQLSISDADQNQSAFQTSVVSANGNLGSLSLAADGSYTYSVDNAATQYLGAAETKVDTFTVKSLDGTSKDISFTIHGTQDAPDLTVGSSTSGASDSPVLLSISAALIDTSSTLLVKITGLPSGFTLNYGAAIDEGVWGLSAADLGHADLALIPDPAALPGSFTLQVTAISNDGLHQASSPISTIAVDISAGANVQVGQLLDGYIAGATVFADADNDGVLDADEAHTTTNADGSFSLVGGTGTLVSIGGTDLSTGLAITGVLKAPAGSTVITPLTTLITALVDSTAHDPTPLSAADAESAVKTAFGLGAAIDLKTFDPVEAVVNGTDPTAIAAATKVLSAAIQVQSTITQVSSVGGSTDAVVAAIADVIIAAPATPLDLSAASTVSAVVTGAIANVDQTTLDAVTSVVSAANDSIKSATTLTELAQAGQVAQGAAADQLANTDFGNPAEVTQLQQAFVTDLNTKVASAVVGDVDGAQLGTLGDDVLAGGNGSDSIDGLDGNDRLSGGAGNDFLYGGAGKDYVSGGSGDDILDGGPGFDRAVYTDATDGVTINLAAGTASGAGVGTDTLVNIEAAIGSDFDDTFNGAGFTGDAHVPGTPLGFNEFEGKGGNDTIISNTNSQGAELTRVSYVSATGAVTVDLAAGYAQGDASVGHDTLLGSGFNGAWGSAYNDTILGSNNPMFTAEVYAGFAGNDYIDGRGGFDRVDYNVDPNTTTGITVNLAAGTVTGDATIGTDTLRGIEAIRGTNFADTYTAVGFGSGSVNAGSSGTFNEFTGNGGDDLITGNGFTRLGFNNATAGVQVDFVTGMATGDSSVGTDHFTGVNAVQASMFGDTLLGGATNDTFTGLAGDDYIDGRGGFDVASYNNIFFTTGGITVNMAAGTVTGDASIGTDTLRSIEGIQGTNFVDHYDATGFSNSSTNAGNNGTFNQFEGLGGDDVITGNGNTRLIFANATGGVTINLVSGTASGDASSGNDTFTGVNSALGSNFDDVFNAAGFAGPNGNQFQGQGGDDQIFGNGSTQLQFNNATGGVTINLAAGTASGDASVGHDSFSGVNSVIGSNFSDVYDASGFAGFNSFQGNAGNDTITGNGSTQILYGSATSAVVVNLTAGTADGDGSVGHDTITGGVTSVFGSNFNDTIIGSAGNDSLTGASGNDTLDGRSGNDFLSGGAGADTFVYASGGGFDFIQDFVHGQSDKIDLTGVFGIYSLADVVSHAVQSGPNTVISFSSSDSLTLQNVNLGSLVASDFVFGTPAAPIVGDDNANNLVGTAGGETISGLGGNDRLQGMGGSDHLDGGLGFDRAIYTDATGGVSINLTAGTASGPGIGTDTLVSIEGAVGSNFADTFNAAGFTGDSGIPGAAVGLNEFEGGAGDDVIIGSANASAQILTRISYVSATSGVTVDLAAGTADGDASVGHDTFTSVNAIVGSTHDDTLLGTNNPNGTYEQFDARGGNDLIDGRGGYDFASYNQDAATTSGIAVNLAVGTVTGDGSVGTDTLRSIEGVRGTNFADSYDATGFGGSSANAGSFGAFNNFEGMGGNDSVTGNGTTRLQFTQAFDGVTVDIAAGTSHGTAGGDVAQVGTDTFTGVNAVLGSLFDDVLLGSNNSAIGENFQGLAGNDFIDGRGGFDTAQYSNLTYTTGGVSVNMANGIVTGDASTGTDTLLSIEGIQGTIFADTYDATGYGQAGAANVGNNGTFNQFEGQGGDDVITGNGNTRLLFTNATSGVTVSLNAGAAMGDVSIGHDTFTGVNGVYGSNFADTYDAAGFFGFNSFQGQGGNDLITGNGSTQLMFANATGGVVVDLAAGTVNGDASVGHDTIIGGVNGVSGSNFNDTLKGGSGADNLFGNGGADTFVYVSGGGADFVSDFSHAQADKIDLSGVGIYNLADVQAIASQQGSNTFIDFGNGDSLTLQNVNVAGLTVADFIFAPGVHLVGDADPNTLVGTVYADNLSGLAGNDVLQGLGSNDKLDGGQGFDRAVYTEATGSVTVDLAAGTASGAGVGSDTLVNIEGAVGGAFNDTFNAAGFTGSSALPGVAAGQSGFEGGGGDDVITGQINALGQSVTRVEYLGASAAVTVDLAAGTGQGTAAGDLANVGHDTFTNALQGVYGSAFNDTIYGSDNANFTYEVFEGRAGDDYIDGRGGYDMAAYNNDPATGTGITVNLATGTVTGDATVGTDTLRNVEAVRGTIFDDVFDTTGYGAPGALNASTTNGSFNDIAGAGGNDSITGNGFTRLNYSSALAAVTVDLETTAGTAITVAGSATGTTEGTDTFTGVNAVQASMFNDTLLGSSFSNTFTPLGGDDFMDGRGGFDTASYNSLNTVTGGIAVAMAAGTVIGDASIGHDTLRNIEGVQGTGYADTYDATGYGVNGALNVSTSNGNFNQFEGLGGDDVVTGNGATRVLYGNATGGVSITIGLNGAGTATGDASTGHDSFTGGVNAAIGSNFADSYDASAYDNGFNSFQGNGGNDTIAGNGATQVQYSNATSGVVITIGAGGAGSASGDGSVGTDTFTSVNSALGGNFADSYDASGFSGFNSFQGNAGNDTITGNGSTQIQYNNATGAVNVDLAAGTASGDGSVGTDTITGGVNNVLGSNFGDTITGSAGADFLNGNGGNDTINGGGGNDNLNGGFGADTFVYADGGGADFVSDFSHAQADKIDLSGVGIYNLADVQAIASQQGSNTFIDFGNGDSLTLQNVNLAVLTAADFIFAPGVHLIGDADPNTLVGTVYADNLSGLAGNDVLQGLGGNDKLDGGQGFDRADYGDATGGITANLAGGSVSGPGVGTDVLTNIEGVLGSNYADTFNAAGFTGSTGLPGIAAGQSEFEGRGGDDIVVGDLNALGQAVTRLSYLGATSAVTVDIGAGTADGDASVGHDTFSNVSTIWGSASNDTFYGSDNAAFTYETYEGRGGDDYIDGRGGYDQVTYNSDTTTTSGIYVHLAAGTVNGDATVGTDTIRNVEAARGTNFDDTFDATGFGQAGANNVGSSGTFNDFAGAGGNDTVIGNGFTRLNYQIAAASVSVDLETSAVGTTTALTVAGSATGATEGTDTFTGVNAVQGSTFSDTLLGSSFNNNLTGLGGDDYIDGRGGFDTAIYNSLSTVTSGVIVDMAAGTATGDASIGTDTLRSIEGIQGTGYADTYDASGYGVNGALNVSTSNGNFNQFEGLGGDDVITGNGATRVLYGNATGGVSITIGLNGAGTATGDASTGTDSFTGGVNAAIGSNFADSYDASAYNNGYNSFQGNGGNDTITGNGATQVQYSNATSGVVITIGAGGAGSASGDGSVGTDTFTGVNSALGGNFADSYDASGFSGFNSFQGNAGNDTITGNGATQIQYNNATGGVNVNLAAGTASGDGSVGTDTITGGVNNVLGSNFGDTITGSAGADFLNGNGGNDTINGGGGNDNLNGGFGADTFVYADGGGADFVSDFNRGQGDRINVTGVTGIFSLADIQAHATQQGANTVIDFGGGNTITLANIAVGSLVATDFVFNNTVLGTSGNDTLVGSSQIDGIYGLDGTDRLQGLGGNDLLDGGNGFDRAVYTEATGSVTVDLAAGTASGAGVGSDTLVNIEGAVGGAFNDTFNAAGFTGSSALPGVAAGQSGFEGGGGDDVITGQINALGQSVTRVEYLGASAAVTVDLAAGTGQGTAAGDLANVGHDTFTNALQGVYGSAFNDTIYGSDNANFTYEVFEGRAGDDYIDGRGGYDMAAYNNDPATGTGITVNLATGTVTGDATVGTDTLRNVEAVRGTIFDDVFDTTGYGAPGALNASTTNGSFNDIAGAGGNDSITGNGFTRLNYSSALAAVTVDLETTAGTAITVAGSATGTTEGTDTFTGVNAVQASMFNDTLLGSSFSNTFTPLGGDDFMDGRGGFDTASYNSLNTVTGGIAVAMAAGTVIGDASIGHDTLRNIEGVQGTGYADTYDATGYGVNGALNVSTSNGNFNQFEGLGGDDVVTGNGATRVLYSNAAGGVNVTIGANGAGTATGDASTGHDSFTGGVNAAIGSNFADSYDASAYNNGYNSFQGNAGNDTIAGNGATQVQYSNATSGVVITIGAGGAGSASGDGSVGSDTFTGVNSALGGNFADSYDASGFSGFNSFQGNAGNDTITGNGATQIQYNNATGGVNVNLAAGTASGDGSVGTDTITGGVNNVLGSNFGDTITGSAGADFLNGNGGNDTINGGGGNDNLNGGGGNDNFVFISGATAGATIIDFTGNGAAPGDTLEFHGFGLAADGATLTQIGSSNQWLVHSGLDAHEETITINGGVHATDFHFLT